MSRLFRHLGSSVVVHTALIAALVFFSARRPFSFTPQNPGLSVQIENDARPSAGRGHRGTKTGRARLDLRPGFAKGGLENFSVSHGAAQGNAEAQNLLATDGKVLQTFDQLAFLINGNLDYPEALAENGVQGLATLDLYFDHSANVDEDRSQFRGDNRWVRGLLVRAARKGLSDWFQSSGSRLEKDKFRDQHFRVDFVITYVSTQPTEFEKTTEGSYHLVRRSLIQTCLNPGVGGIDLACLAARAAGAISSQVSTKYKIKYQALKDSLEAFDQIDLRGINEEISRKT